MKVVVETPKWSFRKIEKRGGGYKSVFFSPIPTPFNYGFIEGSKGEDEMPLDVIVLGKKLKTGEKLDVAVIGRVMFMDDGRRDDKYIVTLDGGRHTIGIHIFFTLYSAAKIVLGFINHRGLTKNRYSGIEWFEECIDDRRAIPS